MENEINIAKNEKKFNKKNFVLILIQSIIILISIIGAIFIFINNKSAASDPKKFNTSMMIIETDSMEPTMMTNTMIFSKKFDGKSILDIGTVVTYPVKSGDVYITITHRIVGYYYQIVDGEGTQRTYKVYGNKEKITSYEDLVKANKGTVTFIGYLTRGDKYTLEFGASLDDFAIYYSDGTINYNKDDSYYSYLSNDQVLSVWSGKQSKFLGAVVTFLQKPNHLMLCIILPIILLILYNLFLVIREIVNDKKIKAKEDALKTLKENMNINEEEIKRQAIAEYLASLKEKEEKQ